jgi:parvulin-like peptidyl-prolyl isomerase
MMCSLPSIAAEAEVAASVAENPVVARGKNFEVRRAQLDEAWAIYAAKMSRGGKLPDEPRPSVESKLLNHIVETHILLQKATAQEKDRAASEVEALLTNTRKRFQGEDEFKKWLKTTGTTPEAYRRRMIEQRISELVIEREVMPSVSVVEDSVKQYYQQNLPAFARPEQARMRQIFLATNGAESEEPLPQAQRDEKKKRIQEINARLDQGGDFFAIYKEHSEEPWAKDETDGEELLYVRGQLPPNLDAVAFSLPLGKASDIIETSMGYHIVRVSKREPAGRLSYEEVAGRLREFLAGEEVRKRMPDYLAAIKRDAGVEILLPGTTQAGGPL